jgi:hypothetical protein
MSELFQTIAAASLASLWPKQAPSFPPLSTGEKAALLFLLVLAALIPILTVVWLVSYLRGGGRSHARVPDLTPAKIEWRTPPELLINPPRAVVFKPAFAGWLLFAVVVFVCLPLWAALYSYHHPTGRSTHETLTAFLVIIILIVVMYIFKIANRTYASLVQGRRLLTTGRVVEGNVTGFFLESGRRDGVGFEFRPDFGSGPLQGQVYPLNPLMVYDFTVGEHVSILYLPDDLAVSMIYPLEAWKIPGTCETHPTQSRAASVR